ncbi:MAG: aspartate carbamoyltransferase [Oscillospiraceae bacterium]|nr:aspartate carbamoyltransferase [Oscillospiraceae bacterium]
MKNLNHLIDLGDYSVSMWDKIVSAAQMIMKNPLYYKGACTGKIMATLFYEPSTRTQMSFQSAMLRLGGGIIGFDNPNTSSISKGENLRDTTKTISGYSDILVMRHYLEGAAKAAALTADCPIINAGDGGHLHPTQTLTDLLTLAEEKGRLTNLNIGICGDLKYGRTVHSLVRAVSRYKDNSFTFISTPELQMPDYISNTVEFEQAFALEDALSGLDVLYMTRIQRERFPDTDEGMAEYEKQKRIFTLNKKKLVAAKKDLIIMHPLPRVDEISSDVDSDSRAIYFKQANYGMYVRMALILTILNDDIKQSPPLSGKPGGICKNEKCITNFEGALTPSYIKSGETMICEYCEKRI